MRRALVCCAALATLVAPARAAAQTFTFSPTADTYMRSDMPTSSFGSQTTLRVDNDPIDYAYLRFNVQGLQGPVNSATLRLFPTSDATARGVDLRGVADNSWGEGTLTYNTAPPVSGTIASHIGAYAANLWISLDATSLVRSDGAVSMAVTTTSTESRIFGSRESTNPPQLVVDASDVTAPVVDVTAPDDGSFTSSGTPAFTGTAGTLAGDSSTVTVNVYAGSAATGMPVQSLTATATGGAWSTTPLSPLAAGTYTVQAQQRDAAGNLGTSAAHTFTVDQTAPTVTLSGIGNGGWTNDTTPDLSGTAGTGAGDASSVRVRVYSGGSATGTPVQTATASVRSDGTWRLTAPNALPEGTYTAQADQSDAAGNVGVSQQQPLLVDTTPPAPSLTDPPDGSSTQDTTPAIRGSAGTLGGDSSTIRVEVYSGTAVSGTPVSTFTVTQSGGDWSGRVPTALSSGTYTARALQSDAAGNTGAAPAHTFQIDPDAAPLVTLTRPADGSAVGTTTPVFRGSASTVSAGAGAVTVKVFSGTSLTGALVETLTAPVGADGTWSVTATPALSESTYTAQASQTDLSGRTGKSAPATFTVDVTPPDTALDSTPPDPSSSSAAAFAFHASESGGTFQCSVDGASYASCSSPASVSGLADGQHSFAVRAIDRAGNIDSAPASFSWRVDTAAPAVTLTSPPGGSSTIDPSPTFSGAAGTAAGDSDTVTLKIYAGTTTSGTLVQTASTTQSAGDWSAKPASPLGDATYTAQAEQRDSAGNVGRSAPVTVTIAPPVIAAAGDIACDPLNSSFKGGTGGTSTCHQKATSDLLVNQGLTAVLGLGDLQYNCSGYNAFLQSYDISWGRVKPITDPVVGNHEYDTSGGTDCDATGSAAGFFRYWGAQAGDPSKGYYSFDLGSWHIVALNSNNSCKVVACSSGSPQETWLKADLAAHPNRCTLAYWHAPRFSSGGNATSTSQFWKDLYAAGADVVLAGHVHNYERFAPQDPSGNANAAKGIREFVVGTGGASHGSFGTILANSEVHDNTAFGVLKLTLHSGSYDWQFVPEAGKTFTDSGTGTCH